MMTAFCDINELDILWILLTYWSCEQMCEFDDVKIDDNDNVSICIPLL